MSVTLSVPDRLLRELAGRFDAAANEFDAHDGCDFEQTGEEHPRSCAGCWFRSNVNRLEQAHRDLEKPEVVDRV